MWLPLLLGPYRAFFEWYKALIKEWNDEHVDDALRLMGNEFLRSSLASLQASRDARAKLIQIQIKSINAYLQFLDNLAGPGGQPKS
jgi:hypothetical protein